MKQVSGFFIALPKIFARPWQVLSNRDMHERMFLLPYFGGVTAVAGVIAGYLGAHYDKEIALALYPLFWPDTHFEVKPSLFWLVTVLFGIGFTGTFWAQARSSERNSGDLKKAVRQLYTLPPRGFLELYREIVGSAIETFCGATTVQKDELELAIRTQLSGIIALARSFDAAGDLAQYGCNIMLFIKSAGLLAEQAASLQARLKFIEPGVSIANLAGVLDLQLALSVATGSESEPDANLTSFALPIPNIPLGKASATQFDGILPGAPYAYVTQKEYIIEDPDDLMQRASGDDFTRTVRGELRDHFKANEHHIQSFVCIPLYSTSTKTSARPIGVLNIHRNLPNKHASEKFELFSPLLAGITIPLGRLVAKLI